MKEETVLEEQHHFFFSSEMQNLIVMLALTSCDKYSNNEKENIQKFSMTLQA